MASAHADHELLSTSPGSGDSIPNSPRNPSRLLTGVFLVALAMRVYFAQSKGLVLDEFHTRFHGTQESLGTLLTSLRLDNHPPLGILLVHWFRSVLGDSPLALRMPAITCGILELMLVARIAVRLKSGCTRPVALLAVALVASSSLHLDFSTQVRMYALLSCAVTGLTLSLLRVLERGGRHWLLGFWAVIGIHAHYYFFIYGAVLGTATLILLARSGALKARIIELLPSMVLALALCLPWLAWGFAHQLGHNLSPGGDDLGWRGLAEAMVHLLFLNLRLGGEFGRLVFIASAGIALLLGLTGGLQLTRARHENGLGWLLAAGAFGVPVLAFCLASMLPRTGFTWHYILPSLPPLALLISVCPLRSLLTRALRMGVVLSCLALSGLNLASRGSEDFEGAVAMILAAHHPGDLVICAEWQPPFFPMGMPWDYYAPRLSPSPPQREDMRGTHLAQPARLAQTNRVFLLASRLPREHELVRRLEARFTLIEHANFGFGREVYVYGTQQRRPKDAPNTR